MIYKLAQFVPCQRHPLPYKGQDALLKDWLVLAQPSHAPA